MYDLTSHKQLIKADDCRFYLGVPEGRPGQLHMYVVSSTVPRVGTALVPPQCLTCTPAPTLPEPGPHHYEGAATATASAHDSDDWDDQPEPETTTEEPERKKKKKKGPTFT